MVDQVSITLSPGVCTNAALNTLHNCICNSHRFHPNCRPSNASHSNGNFIAQMEFAKLTRNIFYSFNGVRFPLLTLPPPFYQSTKIQQYHFDRPYTFIQFCFDWIVFVFFLFCSRLHISTRICSADCKYFGRCWQRCDIYLSRTTFRWISSK